MIEMHTLETHKGSLSKLLTALVVSAQLSIAQLAEAQPSCQIGQPEAHEPLADRRLFVNFPDGHNITIVGHFHGETSKTSKLGLLATDRDSSNEYLLGSARKRLDEQKAVLKDFREEVSYIVEESKKGSIKFIALENGTRTFSSLNKISKVFEVMALANFNRRGISDLQLLNDAFLVFIGPTRFIKMRSPQTLRAIRIIPIEDDHLMKKSLNSIDEFLETMENFKKSLPAGHSLHKTIEHLADSGFYSYHETLKTPSDQLISSALAATPVEFREKMEVLVKKLIRVMNELNQRDLAKSQKLIQQATSGVYFVGLSHLRSLASKLAEACQSIHAPKAEQSQPTTVQ